MASCMASVPSGHPTLSQSRQRQALLTATLAAPCVALRRPEETRQAGSAQVLLFAARELWLAVQVLLMAAQVLYCS
jgi:hypothetical protein